MSVRQINTEYPVARKDYPCDAWPWLDYDLQYYREEMSPEDVLKLDRAIADGRGIKKGQKYIKITYVDCGEIYTAKCRPDLYDLCCKYDAFQE